MPEPAGAPMRETLGRAAAALEAAGVADPRREAAALMAHVLGTSTLAVSVGHAVAPSTAQQKRFLDLVRARAARVPLQHVVGAWGFHGVTLETPPGVFVPRPETETLVDAVLARLAAAPSPAPRILDLGSGTGTVGIALAAARADARVVAVERDPCAAATTARNARRAGVAGRLAVVRGDWTTALDPKARFDALVSNPPYVPTGAIAALEPEVRDHDPRAALDGGTDGLAFVRRIAREAARLLVPGGLVAVEVGSDQAVPATGLFEHAGLAGIEVERDPGGRARVVVARAWTS